MVGINRSSRPKVISHETRVVSPEILIKSVCNISRPLRDKADLATERERQLTTARAIKQLALPMAERQIGHRKSRFVLSARFAVVNWRSRPVAKSA